MLEPYRFDFTAMGTSCALHLYAADSAAAERIAQAAIAEVCRIEARYSRYRSENVLADINRVARQGGSIAVDEETGGLLDYAYACHARSGGLFDISSGVLREAWDFSSDQLPQQHTLDRLLPGIGLHKVAWAAPQLTFTVPGMELDFGGICKEYAADMVAGICQSQGIQHGLVDLGGDIKVIGPHPDQSPWLIGIRHPAQTGTLMATVALSHGALTSSGDYERCIEFDGKRYSHLLNPLTGWPVLGLSSVSVVAERCLVAGSISSIAMLKGTDGIQWLESLSVPHLWMDETGNTGGNLDLFPRT
ncbi:MAG TPA: FAD:protein FMN transferase [Gallionella sp.]|nr:FAD:protein FMN transferase [Gallionella sp.]